MKNSALFSKLAVFALVGSLGAVTATSAQAAQAAFTPYNPAQAYTGDPAYAQARAQAVREPRYRAVEKHVAPQAGHNLPYADRPYGDPDSW
ncbi:hypothetical protein [Rhodoplanes sp. Z2-YC6860]|uniref:hypothetical protein n=1 Tax=Rhodoplanes sp. Z2-YC6860 TaxID=674703 RepID=UPI00082FF624|nr:hypothetical protein [Rhodoplanes sp. Z2-YC6860]